MTTTNILADIRAGTEFAAKQWADYIKAVRRIGHTESLREANEGLGYNLVKTIPGLLQWIHELQDANEKQGYDLSESRRTIKDRDAEIRSLREARRVRPIEIPAENVVLYTNETGAPECITEEKLREIGRAALEGIDIVSGYPEEEDEIVDLMRNESFRSKRSKI